MNLTNLTSPLKEQTGTKTTVGFVERSVDDLVEKSFEGNGNGLECIAPYHVPIRYMERQSGQYKLICYFFAESLKDLEDVLNSTTVNDDDKLFATAERGELYFLLRIPNDCPEYKLVFF
ncbi:unnamed protein product [Rhizophagus irregularis]|nr:unnamed protein product [Rhizophagus irregularis]